MKNLYKAKKISDGTWVEGQLLISHTGGYWIVTLYDETLGTIEKHRVDESTLCRYTGYKDKKSRNIFENDICGYYGSLVTIKYGKFRGVCCDHDSVGWYYMDGGYIFEFEFEFEKYIKVIGNTYDN